MISSNEFKNGMTILYDGKIYLIMEFMHVKPGKGSAYVRTKLRNMRTGGIIDYSFNAGEKVEEAIIEKKEMQYLYAEGESHFFMDMETYEQLEISENQIKEQLQFMIPEMIVNVISYNGELLGVELADKVTLTITECNPGVKGDTKTSATKDAILETGYLIKVPLFIEQGEKVIVNTNTGKYVSREKN